MSSNPARPCLRELPSPYSITNKPNSSPVLEEMVSLSFWICEEEQKHHTERKHYSKEFMATGPYFRTRTQNPLRTTIWHLRWSSGWRKRMASNSITLSFASLCPVTRSALELSNSRANNKQQASYLLFRQRPVEQPYHLKKVQFFQKRAAVQTLVTSSHPWAPLPSIFGLWNLCVLSFWQPHTSETSVQKIIRAWEIAAGTKPLLRWGPIGRWWNDSNPLAKLSARFQCSRVRHMKRPRISCRSQIHRMHSTSNGMSVIWSQRSFEQRRNRNEARKVWSNLCVGERSRSKVPRQVIQSLDESRSSWTASPAPDLPGPCPITRSVSISSRCQHTWQALSSKTQVTPLL